MLSQQVCIGQREAQHRGASRAITLGRCLQVIGDLSHIAAAQNVLVQHNGNGSAFAWHARGFEGREQAFLFLCVVPGVGIVAYAVHSRFECLGVESIIIDGCCAGCSQAGNQGQDMVVFKTKRGGCRHYSTLFE